MKFISFLFLVPFFLPIWGYADSEKAIISAEQMIYLLKANKERYISLDSKISGIGYNKNSDTNNEAIVFANLDIVARQTRRKAYSQTIWNYSDFVETKTYACTPEYSKVMVERTDVKNIEGRVSPVSKMSTDMSIFTIYDALWDLFRWPWDEMSIGQASLVEKNGLYLLSVPLLHETEPPTLKLYINPDRDYIIEKKEFFKNDGTLLFRMECSDFKKTSEGLWIPYSYTWSHPNDGVFNEYNVKEVTLNKEISEEDLDFAFKEGTHVFDKVAQLEYRVAAPDKTDDKTNDALLESNESSAGSILIVLGSVAGLITLFIVGYYSIFRKLKFFD